MHLTTSIIVWTCNEPEYGKMLVMKNFKKTGDLFLKIQVKTGRFSVNEQKQVSTISDLNTACITDVVTSTFLIA